MSTGFADGLQTNFRYVTVRQVRAAGIPDAGQFGISDDRLKPLIKEMSGWINRLTDQWFLPARLRERVDGAKGSIARMPNQIPILELFGLSLEKKGLISFPYPDLAFQVKKRYVMMVTRNVRLPDYPNFIVMDGVFGWLIDETRMVRTTLASPLNPGDTTVQVVNVAGIRAGDAVLIGNAPEPRPEDVQVNQGMALKSGPAIVDCDPNTVLNTFTVEPIEFGPVPAGTPVVRYGRVPDAIQRAALLMIRDHLQKVGDIDTAESPGGIGTRLNSESVEGYSYSMSPLKAINGPGGGSWTTGNAEVDDILQQYSTPAMYVGLA